MALWGPQNHLGEKGAQTHLFLSGPGPGDHCWVPGLHLQEKGPGLSLRSWRRRLEQRNVVSSGPETDRQTLSQRSLMTEGAWFPKSQSKGSGQVD